MEGISMENPEVKKFIENIIPETVQFYEQDDRHISFHHVSGQDAMLISVP